MFGIGYLIEPLFFNLMFRTIFALLFLSACAQRTSKPKFDPVVVRLNNMAINLSSYIQNSDSANKAINYLDSATIIDSNYFLGYYNKLIFLNQLKQYDKALIAINQLIRLRPNANDIYITGGIIYEKIGDTISSRRYFEKSLSICASILDTMNVKNRNYNMLALNKAINLVLLGQNIKGNLLLKQVYENQIDSSQKATTLSFMNKNKDEIIELATNPPTAGSRTSTLVEGK